MQKLSLKEKTFMKRIHVVAQTLIVVLVCATLFPIIVRRAFSSSPVYMSIEPKAVAPLTDLNSSLNGLEVPATPSAVGDNFTVEIHLRNATTANVPFGVSGIEVHFYFGNLLNYCSPTGFTDYLGTTGGALSDSVLYGVDPGFYATDDSATPVHAPPYTGAAYYRVSAASSGAVWNGQDGMVANVTFKITKQPQANESRVSLPLDFSFTDVETSYIPNPPYSNATLPTPAPHERASGSLVFDSLYAPPVSYSLAVQETPEGSGTVEVRVGGVTQTLPYTFPAGTVVQVEATPTTGYSFSNWTLDGANGGSANPNNITMNSNHTIAANFIASLPLPTLLPVTLTAEPRPLLPLADANSSLNSLEISPTQIVVGDRFVVDLRLHNATQDNVPLGLGSIEAHFYFGNVTDYLRPVSFANKLGASDGVLNPAIQFSVLPKFHDMHGNAMNPPYDNAVSYDVAANSTGMGWNGIDGLVAELTFQITKQPQSSLGENNVSFPMDYTLTSLNDSNKASILHDCVNATITLDSVAEEIAVTNVTLAKTVVGAGYLMNISVTAANVGTVSEDFTVTVYANASVIDSQTISLTGGNSMTVMFVRNTTGFAKGYYTITAVAETVLGETNTTDNTYNAGSVTVTIQGDIDGNGKVGLRDLVQLAIALNSETGQPKWNPNADIDGSGVIDLSDLNILAQNYPKV
jgi:hypothetical protein